MDPLSALAIAAAVVQFVDIGGRGLVKCWQGFRELRIVGSEDDDDEKLEIKQQTMLCELELRVSTLVTFTAEAQLPSTQLLASQPTTPAQQQLIVAASDCQTIRFDIDRILDRILTEQNGEPSGKAKPRWRTLPFTRSKNEPPSVMKEIEDIQEQCERVRGKVLDSVLLCIW